MYSPSALLGVNDPYSSRMTIKRLFRHKTEKHFLVYILTALIFALNHEEPSSRDFTSDLLTWQPRHSQFVDIIVCAHLRNARGQKQTSIGNYRDKRDLHINNYTETSL